MRLKDFKITNLLIISLCSIIVFVIVLGAVAFFQNQNIWNETVGMYEHPLQVRRALGEIKSDMYAMSLEIRNIVSAENDQELTDAIGALNLFSADVEKKFDIVYEKYLGASGEVDSAYEAFTKWNVLNDKTIMLVQTGRIAEAIEITGPAGEDRRQAEIALDKLKDLEDFAEGKGDQFFLSARETRYSIITQFSIILAVILILSGIIVYFLIGRIREPLKELAIATNKFQQGDMDARSEYISQNEFGHLSSSFNSLADTVQSEIQSRKNATKLGLLLVMREENEFKKFCQESLREFMEQTYSQVGAVYLLDDEKKIIYCLNP